MAQDLAALTNTWMLNPYMFDPTQKSNAYSNYNNAALPWPPTYNTGPAGGPVNAATGQPIQSFQQWQAANPGGMSINSTPAQPAAPQVPQQAPIRLATTSEGMPPGQTSLGRGVVGPSWQPQQQMAPQQAQSQQGAAGAGAWQQPNNWQAAINALANPGNPQTMGANVPMVSGSQPSGGVNQSFLTQAQRGGGAMNQGFLNALRSIQGRPQG
jgi:hypothetical protein